MDQERYCDPEFNKITEETPRFILLRNGLAIGFFDPREGLGVFGPHKGRQVPSSIKAVACQNCAAVLRSGAAKLHSMMLWIIEFS